MVIYQTANTHAVVAFSFFNIGKKYKDNPLSQ